MRRSIEELVRWGRRWVHDSPHRTLTRVRPPSLKSIRNIPAPDFVSNRFDLESVAEPSLMMVLLSTPRSGSSWICELLHNSGRCTAHEYFQHHLYVPLLAYRWNCVEDGHVRWDRYVSALERYRTSAQGILGVDIHGSHLPCYMEALPYFSAREVKYVWLQRRNKLRQAVSYGIARQTGQWSSDYPKQGEPRYDRRLFQDILNNIHRQEDMIRSFLHLNSISADLIFYEDVAANPETIPRGIFGVDLAANSSSATRLRKQSNATNEQFAHRLASDLLETT